MSVRCGSVLFDHFVLSTNMSERIDAALKIGLGVSSRDLHTDTGTIFRHLDRSERQRRRHSASPLARTSLPQENWIQWHRCLVWAFHRQIDWLVERRPASQDRWDADRRESSQTEGEIRLVEWIGNIYGETERLHFLTEVFSIVENSSGQTGIFLNQINGFDRRSHNGTRQ